MPKSTTKKKKPVSTRPTFQQMFREAQKTPELWKELYSLSIQREQMLEDAIRWALGEKGDFPARQEGEGAYWWRSELRRRAGLNGQ